MSQPGPEPPEFYVAILSQDLLRIRALVAAGESLGQSWNGMSPLSFAVGIWRTTDTEGQKIKVVAELLRLGAEVNRPNQLGATPLDDATMGGKRQLAALLVENGGRALLNPTGVSNTEVDRLTAEILGKVKQGGASDHPKEGWSGLTPVTQNAIGCLGLVLAWMAFCAL